MSPPLPPHLRMQTHSKLILSKSTSTQTPETAAKAYLAAAMSNILSARDANAQVIKSSPEKKEEKLKTLDYQRELLNKRLTGDK